jgi:putative aldouronate transport system substrate-binding protein
MGSASIDEFTTFVDNWRKLGGDAIIKEVNDWKAQQ